MKPERWDEVDKILQSVLERAPADRRAYVDEVCAGDERLRGEVLTLLGSYESAGSFMQTPAVGSGGGDAAHAEEFGAGDAIGQYRVVRPLGRGGMGEVYLAEHTGQSRTVALKVLPAHFTDDAERVRRFRQEARAVLALNHPNVVTVYDIGEAAGVHFISTEFVEGETLRARLTRERLTVAESVEIASQIAAALAYAHERGVVHRDIKPENVMLRPDGYVKVLDFGIAKLTERGAALAASDDPREARTRMRVETSPGMVMGTAHYMSPEQARGKKVDERTDTWSLGVILYEMLTGLQPFDGETPSDIIGVILQRDPAPLSALLPGAPAELERVVSKALDKSPDERYQTAKDFLADLRRFKRRHERDADLERSTPPGERTQIAAQVSTGGGQAGATGANESGTAAGAGQTTSSAEYIVGEFKRHRVGVLVALAALAVVVAAAGLAAYRFWNTGGAVQGAEGGGRAPKLTPLPVNGVVYDGTLSPDGKYLVYKLKSGVAPVEVSMWVKHLPTNTAVQILPPTKDYPNELRFSGDSNYVYYAQLDYATKVWSLSKISVLGGAPKKLIENLGRADFAPSPDGKQMAFVRLEPNGKWSLLVTNEDGTGERVLVTYTEGERWFASPPAWSPDGKMVAAIAGSSVRGYDCSPLVVNVADGTQRQLDTVKWRFASDLVWLGDGTGLLASVGDDTTAPRQIWYVSYPEGAAHRVTNDLNEYRVASVTADGKTLLANQYNTSKDIWVGPVSADASQLKQVTFTKQDEVRGGAWTPDGRIVFTSVARATSLNLWVMNADGTDRRQITSGDEYDYNPATSSDGRTVFFTSQRNGLTPHIWRVDMNGGNLKQLTSGDFEDTNPSVTPDGKWVLFNSYRGGPLTAWKVGADGGEPVQLSKTLAVRAISPDGRLMACWDFNQQPGVWKVFILPIEGGEPLKVFELTGELNFANFGWTADGRAITNLRYATGTPSVWALPVDGGKPTQLTHFNNPPGDDLWDRYALSRDGKLLAVTRKAVSVSYVLVTDFK